MMALDISLGQIQIDPTNQQVRATCDTIIAQAADHIFEKLYFYIITPLKSIRNSKGFQDKITKQAFNFLPLPKGGDYIILGEPSQLEVTQH